MGKLPVAPSRSSRSNGTVEPRGKSDAARSDVHLTRRALEALDVLPTALLRQAQFVFPAEEGDVINLPGGGSVSSISKNDETRSVERVSEVGAPRFELGTSSPPD